MFENFYATLDKNIDFQRFKIIPKSRTFPAFSEHNYNSRTYQDFKDR